MTRKQALRYLKIFTALLGFFTAIFLCGDAVLRFFTARPTPPTESPFAPFGRKIKATADSLLAARRGDDATPPGDPRHFIEVGANPTGIRIQAGVENRVPPPGRATARLSDYPPGVFRLDSAPAAYALIGDLVEAILRAQALLPPGARIRITVRGTADALPVRAGRVYPEGFDVVQSYPYFSLNRGRPAQMTLIPGRSALTNENLAFKRAHEVVKLLELVQALRDAEIDIETEELPGIGGPYRSVLITVEIESRAGESAGAPRRLARRPDVPRT